jgi:hypothetical protein
MLQYLIDGCFADPRNSFEAESKNMLDSELTSLAIKYSNFLDGSQTCYSIFNGKFVSYFLRNKL